MCRRKALLRVFSQRVSNQFHFTLLYITLLYGTPKLISRLMRLHYPILLRHKPPRSTIQHHQKLIYTFNTLLPLTHHRHTPQQSSFPYYTLRTCLRSHRRPALMTGTGGSTNTIKHAQKSSASFSRVLATFVCHLGLSTICWKWLTKRRLRSPTTRSYRRLSCSNSLWQEISESSRRRIPRSRYVYLADLIPPSQPA